MAREQRKDVDYFPHQCKHGRKMHIIETKYGNDGYAVWHKLLEQLGTANFHYIDISDDMTLMYLVSIFKVDQKTAISILDDLAKLGAIDGELYFDHKVIYSQKFVDSIADAYRKRKSNPLEYSDLLVKIGVKSVQSGGRLAEETKKKAEVIPKEKKRKEKKRREEENAREFSPDIDTLYPIEKLVDHYLMNLKLKEAVMKSQNIKKEIELDNFLFEFHEHLKSTDAHSKKWNDFTGHFLNWLRKKKKFKSEQKSNAPTSNIPIG